MVDRQPCKPSTSHRQLCTGVQSVRRPAVIRLAGRAHCWGFLLPRHADTGKERYVEDLTHIHRNPVCASTFMTLCPSPAWRPRAQSRVHADWSVKGLVQHGPTFSICRATGSQMVASHDHRQSLREILPFVQPFEIYLEQMSPQLRLAFALHVAPSVLRVSSSRRGLHTCRRHSARSKTSKRCMRSEVSEGRTRRWARPVIIAASIHQCSFETRAERAWPSP